MKNYGIKERYKTNGKALPFDDTPFKDEWQDEVYKTAWTLAQEHGLKSVVDVGCGSGFKLMKYFRDFDTVGIDRKPTVKFLRETYPDRKWLEVWDKVEVEPDLVINSDVIEHVDDPDQLLDSIMDLRPRYVVLSTPDRDLLKMGTEDGPPRNCHHVREWNHDEMHAYLSERFEVVASYRDPTMVFVLRSHYEVHPSNR